MESLKNRQENILEKLQMIKKKLSDFKTPQFNSVSASPSSAEFESLKIGVLQDLVISTSPANPPYFLIPLKKLLQSYNVRVLSTCTTHSSVDQVDPKLLKLFREEICKERSSHDLSFTVILKNQNKMSLMVNPLKQSAISGEANILRYISRLFPASSCVNFEAQGSFVSVSETDYWLDATQSKFLQGNNKERQSHLKQLNSKLGTETWLSGSTMGLFDVFSWSVILQAGLEDGLPSNVSAWFKRMNDTIGFERGTETPPLSNTSDVSQTSMKRDDLELFLKKNDIKFQSKNHEEVFTVEALMNCVNDMPGMHMKNLFLKDKKKNLYLLAAKHDAKVQLSNVGNQVGAKDLRFGDEETLYQTLGVKQGCVTVFALINDPTHRVKLLLDDQIMNTSEPFVNFHPLTNDATLGISPKDMQKFIHLTGHEIQLVHL